MSEPINIIFLNGVGSAGKSTIAKELQLILPEPYLHVGIDTFLEMLPEKHMNSPDGFEFISSETDGYPVIEIKVGKAGEKLLNGMRQAIVALAEQGNHLIIDEVLIGRDREAYELLLAPYQVYYVGVFAPLELLEVRERARGDRLIGLARGQFDLVHQGMRYDLQIDTSSMSPENCAALIVKNFRM